MGLLPEVRESRYEFNHAYWWVLAAATGWLAFAVLTLEIPKLHNPLLANTAQIGSVGIGLLLLLTILLAAERPHWPVAVRVVMFGAGAALVGICYVFNLHEAAYKPAVALALMAVAVPVGYWIGERMEKITNLIPLAIAMSMADIFSVFQGPTKHLQENLATYHEKVQAAQTTGVAPHVIEAMRAPLADYIIVHFPIAGLRDTLPILGIGDFIVLAFLFRAAWVHHVSPRLMLWSTTGSICAALGLATGLEMGLPALPFIALGTISVLWLLLPRMRKLDRQEVVLSIGVAALFGALITGKYLSALLGAR